MCGKNNREEQKLNVFQLLGDLNVFEGLILPDGTLVEALPSHTSKAESLCLKKLGINREELWKRCPKEASGHYMEWLLNICGAISVWATFYKIGTERELTKEQYLTLRDLKLRGIYKGAVTRWRL